MKHEWRKKEKAFYHPKNQPEIIEVPELNFITIHGEGSPDDSAFSDCIAALYSVAYTIKMMSKKHTYQPKGYADYTVYPLEGIWDIRDEVKAQFQGVIDKADLVYKLMIRQPDFVSESIYLEMLDIVKSKKHNALLTHINYEKITEGRCVQMLHLGPFTDEPKSFEKMEEFTAAQGLIRLSKIHREIYLSDFRRVTADKLKTVLRFKVQ